MKELIYQENFRIPESTCVTIGKFDGLHIGHRRLISEMRKTGLPVLVLSVCFADAREILTASEQEALLTELGVDYPVRLLMSKAIQSMSPERFVTDILLRDCRAKSVVVGENFRFGYNRSGDVALLRTLCKEAGVSCTVLPLSEELGETVSSTRIRQALNDGDIPLLNRLLGYAYPVSGIVQKGRKIGRQLNFPTVNLCPPEEKLLPPFGVYRTVCRIGEQIYASVTNVGNNPTVRDGTEHSVTVETHIPGFDRDVYGGFATVSFYEKLRDQVQFDSLESLQKQLVRDTEAATAGVSVKDVQVFPAFFEK